MNAKNKKYLIYGGIIIALLVAFVFVWLASRAKVPGGNPEEIVIQNDEGTLRVNRNGQVSFSGSSGEYVDQWSQDKTNVFFNYIYDKYGQSEDSAEEGFPGSVTFTLNGETKSVALEVDELVETVVEETSGGGGGGGGGGDEGGGDVADYFGSPTPAPTTTTTTTSGPSGPTPTPYNPDPHPDCLYWKLSYCAIPRTPTPAPSVAPTGNTVIQATDCTDWNSQQGNNTIINNTVCIPSE